MDFQRQKRSISNIELNAQDFLESGWWRYLLNFNLNKISFSNSIRGSLLAKLFYVKYNIDLLDMDIGIEGLDSVTLYNVEVVDKTRLTFTIAADKVRGNINADIDYTPDSYMFLNQTYCPFGGFFPSDWARPCPSRALYVDSSFELVNFKVNIDLNLKINHCSGAFFKRYWCHVSKWIRRIISVATFDWKLMETMVGHVQHAKINDLRMQFDEVDFHLDWYYKDTKMDLPYGWEHSNHMVRKDMPKHAYLVGAALMEEQLKNECNELLAEMTSNYNSKGCMRRRLEELLMPPQTCPLLPPQAPFLE